LVSQGLVPARQVRRLPGSTALLRGPDLDVQRRVLQSAVEPDHRGPPALAGGGVAVCRRARPRRLPGCSAAVMALGCRRPGLQKEDFYTILSEASAVADAEQV